MKDVKKLISALLVFSFIFIGSACGSNRSNSNSDSIGINGTTAASAEDTGNAYHITDTTTVYWAPRGKVYHVDEDCSTLSRSTNIASGTPEEAKEAGKSRLCEVCGKGYTDDTN